MNIQVSKSQLAGDRALAQNPNYPTPVDMVHASIFSGANFKKVLEFYQIVLNMRVVYEMSVNLRFVALSFDEENHRIGLVEIPHLVERPPNTVRIEHTSWRYRNLKDVLATARRVEQELGLFPVAVHQGTLISLSYKDPDANRCELIVECLPSQAEIIHFYVDTLARLPDFNTLLPFDLRGMLERDEAGEDVQNLVNYEWVRDNLPHVEGKRLF